VRKKGGKDTNVNFTPKQIIYNITLVEETNKKLHPIT
jgi:hypothetical protein